MARILLAEDDDSLRRFLARGLEMVGHEVVDVRDGVSAVAALEAGPYDLLIADIVMPGTDGIELARQAADEMPELKVMFITGFAAVALKAQSVAASKGGKVLSKPFHLKDLVDEVETALAA